jgi:peptide-methionine (R)-S-oxide reductase
MKQSLRVRQKEIAMKILNAVKADKMLNLRETSNTMAPFSSRRGFLLGSAGALGACALAILHPMSALGAGYADQGKSGSVNVIQFGQDGKKIGKVSLPRVVKTEAEWQKTLSPVSFAVARKSGTERAYTGATWDEHGKGIFRCVCCDLALFSSETKFDSGTGWPSFWQPIARENVSDSRDESLGMLRSAVSCTLCDAHLGHVFDDGPRPTGLRYCMNSASMQFRKFA